MKKLLLISIVLIQGVWANELKVRPNVDRPVLNQNFTVDFIISTEEEGEPIINFEPLGAEVVDRSPTQTSTRVTIINGQRSMERTMTISFELVPKKVGFIYIRNIEAEINGKKLTHKTINLSVLKEPKELQKIFFKAETTSKQVYVGESIIVRYYLYSRADVPLTGTDIKKFPKLSKFMKRFHQEQMNPERVSVDGNTYIKRIMYTAQLFAEKPGTYHLDPMSMKISYSNRSNSFGSFGFNLQIGKPMTRSISSPEVDIEVVGLPATGMPKSFSGLVGKHDFQIKLNKNKFIANEPIEIQLITDGAGALELFEAPRLIEDSRVEEFEKNSDLTIGQDFTARKITNYTYLGRESASLGQITIPISYFDLETQTYITKELELGKITVAGATSSSNKQIKENQPISTIQKNDTSPENQLPELSVWSFKPIFKALNFYMYHLSEVIIALLLIVILMLLFFSYQYLKNKEVKELSEEDYLFKFGINYYRLYQLLTKSGINGDMKTIIKELHLSKTAENYFLEIVDDLNNNFTNDKKKRMIKLNKKYLKELIKNIKNINGNNQRLIEFEI